MSTDEQDKAVREARPRFVSVGEIGGFQVSRLESDITRECDARAARMREEAAALEGDHD